MKCRFIWLAVIAVVGVPLALMSTIVGIPQLRSRGFPSQGCVGGERVWAGAWCG
jgi:hypothetical protein